MKFSKAQRTMERKGNPAGHMGPPRHQITMEQILQAWSLGISKSADFKPSLQLKKAARKARFASSQLKKTIVYKKARVLWPLFKVFVRQILEFLSTHRDRTWKEIDKCWPGLDVVWTSEAHGIYAKAKTTGLLHC